MVMKSDLQNKLTAVIVALIGLFQFLSYIMPQIQKPVEAMIAQLPPGFQVIAMGMVGLVLIVVYVWNYTSSIEHGEDKKIEGVVETLESVSASVKLNPGNEPQSVTITPETKIPETSTDSDGNDPEQPSD